MLAIIMEHLEELVAVVLFGIGFTTLLLKRNIIKKIIGFNIMDTAIYLFLTSVGYIEGRTAPIMVDGITDAAHYINPIPSGLVLTGIVVSVSVSAPFFIGTATGSPATVSAILIFASGCSAK